MPIVPHKLFEVEEHARPLLIRFLEDMVRVQEREAEAILAFSALHKKAARPAGQDALEPALEPPEPGAAEALRNRAALNRVAIEMLAARPAVDPAALRVAGIVSPAPVAAGVTVRLRDEKPCKPPIKVTVPVSVRGDFVLALEGEKVSKAGGSRSFVVEILDAKGKRLGPPSRPFQFAGNENFFWFEFPARVTPEAAEYADDQPGA